MTAGRTQTQLRSSSIVAALCWYDEPIHFLERMVRSLDGIADAIVAYDGAWEHTPGGRRESPAEQAWALADAVRGIGIDYTLYTPARVWASQVDKRNALMAEACKRGDWILVIDGDDWITGCDRTALDIDLRTTPYDVAHVTATNITRSPDEKRIINTPTPIRRLFRSSAGITVQKAHNGYRTADGRWLNGDSAYVRLAPACRTTAQHIHLSHESISRGPERNAARAHYRMERRRLGLESWA